MSGTTTIRYLGLYEQNLDRKRHFSSLFRTPEKNFHSSDQVEQDVIRRGQDIAIPVVDATAGYRYSERRKSVNKTWTPAVFKEASKVNANELTKRLPGNTPYDSPAFNAVAGELAMNEAAEIERRVRDAVELMCSQVLQTGKVTATDENGETIKEVNFFPLDGTGTLASGDLIVTVGIDWAEDGTSGEPESNLLTLIGNMQARGYTPDRAYFGTQAWLRYLRNPDVLEKFNLRNASFGRIVEPADAQDATRHGNIVVGDYLLPAYTYNGGYADPQTGAFTRYLNPYKVVLIDSTAPRDLTFGRIARFDVPTNAQTLSFLPTRLEFARGGFGMTMISFLDEPRENLTICCGTRPLPIPTAIDSFACATIGS